jgi:hypothetical protein
MPAGMPEAEWLIRHSEAMTEPGKIPVCGRAGHSQPGRTRGAQGRASPSASAAAWAHTRDAP